MATNRPSALKRQREQKKRDRQLRKAARAAERRAAQPPETLAGQDSTTDGPPREDAPCST